MLLFKLILRLSRKMHIKADAYQVEHNMMHNSYAFWKTYIAKIIYTPVYKEQNLFIYLNSKEFKSSKTCYKTFNASIQHKQNNFFFQREKSFKSKAPCTNTAYKMLFW